MGTWYLGKKEITQTLENCNLSGKDLIQQYKREGRDPSTSKTSKEEPPPTRGTSTIYEDFTFECKDYPCNISGGIHVFRYTYFLFLSTFLQSEVCTLFLAGVLLPGGEVFNEAEPM